MRVLVAGAGIIGLSIADALARRGLHVTVLEMRAPGAGASRASAGLLAPFTEAEPGAPLLALGTRSLSMFDDFIRRLRETSGAVVEYARTGTLEVAFDDTEFETLLRASAWLSTQGIEHRALDAAALASMEPAVSRRACGGLFISTHGFVGVRSLVTALAQSARHHGAILDAPVEVLDVTIADNEVIANSGARVYRADRFVLASGAWSSRIRIRGLSDVPVRPVRGQLLQLQWPDGPMTNRVVWSRGCYTVPWSDGTLLVGATMEDAGFVEAATTDGVETLTRSVKELLPDSGSARFIEARAGLRPATPDSLPLIGTLPDLPNLIFATGHFRNGILLAPLTAAMVDRIVMAEGDDDAMMKAAAPERYVTFSGA